MTTRGVYERNHSQLRKLRGKASESGPCVDCGGPARQWSQIHGTNGTNPLADYEPRCVKCHSIYDHQPYSRRRIKWRLPIEIQLAVATHERRQHKTRRYRHSKSQPDYARMMRPAEIRQLNQGVRSALWDVATLMAEASQ